jgi:hypothetical protein
VARIIAAVFGRDRINRHAADRITRLAWLVVAALPVEEGLGCHHRHWLLSLLGEGQICCLLQFAKTE